MCCDVYVSMHTLKMSNSKQGNRGFSKGTENEQWGNEGRKRGGARAGKGVWPMSAATEVEGGVWPGQRLCGRIGGRLSSFPSKLQRHLLSREALSPDPSSLQPHLKDVQPRDGWS